MSEFFNKAQKTLYLSLAGSVVGLVIVFLLFRAARPAIVEGALLEATTSVYNDSTLVTDRQVGLVDLERFLGLASRLSCFDAKNADNYKYTKDSVTITLSSRDNTIFFDDYSNVDDMRLIAEKFDGFPISVNERGTSFTAEKIKGKDGRCYIRIPYFILTSLAKELEPPAVEKTRSPKVFNDLPSVLGGEIKTQEMENNQIETGDLVARNFNDIIVKNVGGDSEQQLKTVWRYVKDHWRQVRNENSSYLTWRRATETIRDYYNNGKVYMGDCEDFAILMASFARQAGFQSRCVCIHSDDGGYMYAQYREKKGNSKWKSLDMTKSFNSAKQGTVIVYYE